MTFEKFAEYIDKISFSSAIENEIAYSRTQFLRGEDYYKTRIQAIEFPNNGLILDAACGCGQWSFSLKNGKAQIYSMDYSEGLIEIAQQASDFLDRQNVSFQRGDLHKLPYKTNSFDAVFCYSALMYCNEDLVLKEFARILKTNGKLYICSDGPMVPLYKMIHGLKCFNIRLSLSGIKILINTLYTLVIRRKQIQSLTFLRKSDIHHLLFSNGFEVHYYGAEGSYNNENLSNFEPIYGMTYFGLPVDYEIIGIKK